MNGRIKGEMEGKEKIKEESEEMKRKKWKYLWVDYEVILGEINVLWGGSCLV